MRYLTTTILSLLLFANAAHAQLEFVSLAYHDVRKDVTGDYDPDQYAISTHNLAAHFAWLKHNGFTPVSIDDLIAAANNERPLPERAILLTFDDGLKSTYTDVFPLLKVFNYPAVVSVVTDWMDLPPGKILQYGDEQRDHTGFISWAEAREMEESGLVEIASHTANLHRGATANPQANQLPAAITHEYRDDRYETDEEFAARIRSDLERSAVAIRAALGHGPRVITWPYGKYTLNNLEIAASAGMPISFSLDTGVNKLPNLGNVRRILIQENPGIDRLSADLLLPPRPVVVRAAQINLDHVYDDDQAQQNRNLDRLLDRIKELQISHVFLQAFADPDANGSAAELYFPNRRLPMRADLFTRVAWQLKTRSEVEVYAWLPLNAYDGPAIRSDWRVVQHTTGEPDPTSEPRLSPYHPDARQFIRDIYEDLAAHAAFDGVLFHEDARLGEHEDASPAALETYRQKFGDDFAIASVHEDAELSAQWSRLKTESLVAFGQELTDILRDKKPDLKTVRNLFAPVVLDTAIEQEFAQSLELFLTHYDYVALLAKPQLQNSDNPDHFLSELTRAISEHEGGLDKTIFELQSIDWRNGNEISGETMFRRMRALQAQGVKHLAFYADDFMTDLPELDRIRQGMSLAEYPFTR
jgi:biofilm PGA synthesis lipoprotein PgaB